MLIIGDENIPYETFTKITNINDITNTKSNSTVLFTYDISLIKYTKKNDINTAVLIKDVKEAIYCNALDVRYIICEKNIAQEIQNLADNYIFDSKILALITSNNEFEDIAQKEIDGVIYESVVE